MAGGNEGWGESQKKGTVGERGTWLPRLCTRTWCSDSCLHLLGIVPV